MKHPVSAFKLSGGGNDFIALIEPDDAPGVSEIRAWCTRGLSWGADGLFTLARLEESCRMDYYNADGKAADLCLNGTRCAARLSFELGWSKDHARVVTGAGPIEAYDRGVEGIALELDAPTGIERLDIDVGGRTFSGSALDVGVPQFVLQWPSSLSEAPVAELGPRIRRHPHFGTAGTNVMFVRFFPPDRLGIRSYERGVEAETLACGTGVLASVAVGREQGLELPVRALTGGGFELTVEATVQDDSRWLLCGDARLLGRLEIAPGASALPPHRSRH